MVGRKSLEPKSSPGSTESRPTGKSAKSSALLDTRVVYCGNNLEQLANSGKWKCFTLAIILLACMAPVVRAANVQIKSEWDAELLNVTNHNVSIETARMQWAWEKISKQYLLRANFYMDAGADSDTNTFEFNKESATWKELLEAFLAAFPAYTYTQNPDTGVIWIHPKRIKYEDILSQKIKIDRPAHQVSMYSEVFAPLLKLLDPNVVDSYDDRAGMGHIGSIDLATGKPPISPWMQYDVDLPAGVYSAREILDFCCIANPSKAFVVCPAYGKPEPLVLSLELLQVFRNPLAPSAAAVKFWELEIGNPTNGIPSVDEVSAALSDTNPAKRQAAVLYWEAAPGRYSAVNLINKCNDSEKAVWVALGADCMIYKGSALNFFNNVAVHIPGITNDLKQIKDPGLALVTSLELTREKQDTSYLDAIVSKHTYTIEEIASIKPELVRMARSSEAVRDKLKAMKSQVPDLSSEALDELANTNFLTLVSAEIK